MEDNGALSPSMPVPLPLPLPMLRWGHYDGDDYAAHGQLAVVPQTTTTTTTSRFKLPDGWRVQKVLRSDGCRIDKYYHEPETGHKFRSLKEIERYIKGEVYRPRQRSLKNSADRRAFGYGRKSIGSRKMIISGGKVKTSTSDSFRPLGTCSKNSKVPTGPGEHTWRLLLCK
ncbi:unnamed protein product [Ilex paraguariensis]|uniref:MBD domain-containing protein n=1 Tax=Ilex paraguariensis TaxID=185542 RepID=A0ABC8THI6_9AQUA